MINAVQEVGMWVISHIVFAYLHFVPGGNGGWTQGSDYPRFSTDERRDVAIPFEGYWQRVS
jgi:hypothetical protein